MIDIRTYLELEVQLHKRLRKTWKPIAAKLQAKVVDAIDQGDFAKAYSLAKDIDLTSVGEKNKQYIKYLMLACANFGARMATDSKTTFVSGGAHDKLMEAVAENFCKSLELNATVQVYKAVVQSIAKVQEELKTVEKAEKPRYVREFVDFTVEGDKIMQLISSLHTSRLAVWGFAAEADLLGLTTYKLSAVLDGRTSAFCRAINGKVFKVDDARKSINEILSVQNPDDVKALQPWPKQDKASMEKYAEMTAEELTAAGLHIPPFHPGCRTMLVRVGKAPRTEKPSVPKEREKLPKVVSTKETFEELGLTVTDSALKHWNDFVGVSPVAILAKLTGFTPQEILDGVLGKLYRTITIGEDGDIKFQTKMPIGKGKLDAQMVYDPFTGTMHMNYAEFKKAKPQEAAAFLKRLMANSAEVAETIGASTLSLVAAGDLGAYTYSKMGLLPAPGDWFDIKESIIQALDDGKLPEVVLALSPGQMGILTDLLNSKNEKAMQMIANLPFKVGGKDIGEVLFKGVKFNATLDLTDAEKVSKFVEVVK